GRSPGPVQRKATCQAWVSCRNSLSHIPAPFRLHDADNNKSRPARCHTHGAFSVLSFPPPGSLFLKSTLARHRTDSLLSPAYIPAVSRPEALPEPDHKI